MRTGVVSLTWVPPVSCTCGERHQLGRRYYVSVLDGSKSVLALGPFLTHPEAIAHVDDVRRAVIARFNPHGRAHFYGYGTAAVIVTDAQPGRLNAEMGRLE